MPAFRRNILFPSSGLKKRWHLRTSLHGAKTQKIYIIIKERWSIRDSMYELLLNETLMLTRFSCRTSRPCSVAGTRTSPVVSSVCEAVVVGFIASNCRYRLEPFRDPCSILPSYPGILLLVLHLHIHCVHNTTPANGSYGAQLRRQSGFLCSAWS
jgi:hypothetical protein